MILLLQHLPSAAIDSVGLQSSGSVVRLPFLLTLLAIPASHASTKLISGCE